MSIKLNKGHHSLKKGLATIWRLCVGMQYFSLDGKEANKQYFCKSIISYMCCPKENFHYCYLDNHKEVRPEEKIYMHYNNCLMEMIWFQRNFMITYDDITMYLLSHQWVSIKFTHWALNHFVSMSMKYWLDTNVVFTTNTYATICIWHEWNPTSSNERKFKSARKYNVNITPSTSI